MRRLLAIPILVIMLAGVVSCTKPADDGIASADGAGAPSGSSSVADDFQSLMNFARCMREHGQNLPDPDPDGEEPFPPRITHGPGWGDAEEACRGLLPAAEQNANFPDAQELEQLRAFAVCMREHDIPMSDPELPGAGSRPGNMTIGGRFEDMTRIQVGNDPAYKAAFAACRDKQPSERNRKDGQ